MRAISTYYLNEHGIPTQNDKKGTVYGMTNCLCELFNDSNIIWIVIIALLLLHCC